MFRILGSLLNLLILAAIGFAAVYFLGSHLPRERTEIAGTLIHAPQARVWAILNDPQALIRFRPSLQRVTPLPARDGHPCWLEAGAKNSTLCETASVPQSSRTVATVASTEAYTGTWTYKLTPTDARATEVICTETSIVPSPLLRFVGHYIFRQDTVLAKSYLDSLKNAAERP